MNDRRLGVALVALTIAVPLAAQPPSAPYEVVVETVTIRARDGVGLATDVYRPAREGSPVAEPLPVLLQRTPYGKRSERFVASATLFANFTMRLAMTYPGAALPPISTQRGVHCAMSPVLIRQ